jgi:hypothetical protein
VVVESFDHNIVRRSHFAFWSVCENIGLAVVGQTHLVGIQRRTNREFGADFLGEKSF